MKKLIALLAIATFTLCSGCRTHTEIGILPLYQQAIEIDNVQGAPKQQVIAVIVIKF